MTKFCSTTFVIGTVLLASGFTFASPGPSLQHVDQQHLTELVRQGKGAEAFAEAFEAGDEFFSHVFTDAEGVGANVGDGTRFATTPRADLNGPGQWANHYPSRSTGPNSASCVSCHNQPFEDGASATVELRDPYHMADSNYFIRRNTTPLFGLGALQRLAEEMTDDLQAGFARTQKEACQTGKPVQFQVVTKGVHFGDLTVSPTNKGGEDCRYKVDSHLDGIDADLVLKPLQWKGSVSFIRDFNRGASHNELGLQAVELVGDGADGDYDGTVDETSVGDITALVIYNAAQPRPTNRVELAKLGLIPKLEETELQAIRHGEKLFNRVGCTECHRPELKIANPIFSEPSQSPYFRDQIFPAGQDPVARFVDSSLPITFDLTKDQPSNQVKDPEGHLVLLGAFEKDDKGQAIVRLYSDLKRHDMGEELAETIDETGTGVSMFMTRPIWGIGSTAPYLHDARAKTLGEAISYHGGEASRSRARFKALNAKEQEHLLSFLNSLVLFKTPEDRRGN